MNDSVIEPSTYTPPKVWTWNKESGGRFADINRPIAGPTHDKGCRSAVIRFSFIHWRRRTA